jgi:hypothetical protein
MDERNDLQMRIWTTLKNYEEDKREGGGVLGFYEWSKVLYELLSEVEDKMEKNII